jgi:hypothetical protein
MRDDYFVNFTHVPIGEDAKTFCVPDSPQSIESGDKVSIYNNADSGESRIIVKHKDGTIEGAGRFKLKKLNV